MPMAMRIAQVAAVLISLSGEIMPVKANFSGLSFNYYDGLCSGGTARFQSIVDSVVATAIRSDQSLAPSLLRMCFHDCFVQGCDGSILLNSIPGSPTLAEKDSFPNLTVRGYAVIDAVKAALENICPGVFSCADILQEVALAAQRHVDLPLVKVQWQLKYGRRDGLVSKSDDVLANLPPPNFNYAQLMANFDAHGLSTSDLMVLSGAHSYGNVHCFTIFPRLYNFYGNGSGTDPALDPTYAATLKQECPPNAPPNATVKQDVTTPDILDYKYFPNINSGKVLFQSDASMNNDQAGIAANSILFGAAFVPNFIVSMKKMTEISVKLSPSGEVRLNCSRINNS